MIRIPHSLEGTLARRRWCRDGLLILVMVILQSAALTNVSVAQTIARGLLPFIDEYEAGDPIYDEVQRIAGFFASRLGVALKHPVVVVGDYHTLAIRNPYHEGTVEVLAMSMAVSPAPDPDRVGHRRWVHQSLNPGAEMDYCGIYLGVRATAVSQLQLKSTLAHEVFHCFQWQIAGINMLSDLDQWIVEGTASFAGEDYAEYGSPLIGGRWQRYLTEQKSIFDGGYDAMGFFFHLQGRGADVYRAILAALRSDDNLSAIAAIRGIAGDRAFSTWPMGLARMESLGNDWDAKGPAITSHLREISEEMVQDFAPVRVVASAGEQKLFDLYFPDGQVLVLSVFGFGGIAWNSGQSNPLTTLFGPTRTGNYCAKDTCRCDDGSMPEGITEVAWSGDDFPQALVAITGAEQVAVFDASVEDFECDDPAPSCPLVILNGEETALRDTTQCARWSGPAASCLVGSWRQDSGTYIAQMKDMLPTNAVINQAETSTTITITSDGLAQTCIHFSSEIEMEMGGSAGIRTETSAEGASVAKLGLADANTLCAIPIHEEIEATAVVDIGGVISSQSIVVGGAFAKLTKFTCSARELVLVTPVEGVGEVEAKFVRMR